MATTQQYADLNRHIYDGGNVPSGYTKIGERHLSSGYDAAAYRDNGTGEIVLVNRGTEFGDRGDHQANLDILNGKKPLQFDEGLEFYDELRLSNPGAVITTTGQSLGGAISQFVSGSRDIGGETFGSPGIRQIAGLEGLTSNKLVNHINRLDAISIYGEHVGSTNPIPVVPLDLFVFPPNPLLVFLTLGYSHQLINYRNYFAQAKTQSPIILDLDGDGVETLSVVGGANFDHDGNGFAEQTGWVGQDDGLLVWDRNGDGRISAGTELFGNETLLKVGRKASNGFEALAEWDSSGDGKINSSEAIWSSLRVWKDANGNGYTDTGELLTLSALGIQSISTGYTGSNFVDGNNNAHLLIGTFMKTDGTSRTATDVWFQTDKMLTIAEQWLAVPPDVAALPDLQGFGNVYDLHQAMIRDGSGNLKGLVQNFRSQTDPAARAATLEQILFKWTGSDAVNPASRGPRVDARRLAVLEALFAERFPQEEPGIGAGGLLTQSWHGVIEYYYAGLNAQTHLKPLYDSVAYRWEDGQQRLVPDFAPVATQLQTQLGTDPVAAKRNLSEFARTLRGFGVDASLEYAAFRKTFAAQSEELALLVDAGGDNPLAGTAGADTIIGFLSDDFIAGNGGDDVLAAGDGNDILTGDAGTDRLDGGAGSDTYLFGRGGGQDIIGQNDGAAGKVDAIVFDSNVLPADVAASSDGGSLRLSIKGTTDVLTVDNYFAWGNTNNPYKVDEIRFADGTVWNVATVRSKLLEGTIAADTLYGYSDTSDVLNGYDGNDFLYGRQGNDTLNGGNGNDWLFGEDGNDTLNGGVGNDQLDGGNGSDIYRFGRSSGQDVIYQVDGAAGKVDAILFDSNVLPADVTVSRNGDNLLLSINGSTDRLTVEYYFAWGNTNNGYKVDEIRFGNGTVWNVATVRAKLLGGTAAGDTLYGYSDTNDVLNGYDGNDFLYGRQGNDTINGGNGADWLFGEEGNDTLNGDAGNDWLDGGSGNDTYRFGRGGGQDVINQNDGGAGKVDSVSFAADVLSGDVGLSRMGNDLVIGINGTADQLRVANQFYLQGPNPYRVDQFKFADGSVFDLSDVQFGSAGVDVLNGAATDSVLVGYAGADILNGNGGNDLLIGGTEADTLKGGPGNDIYVVDTAGDVITENLNEGTDTVQSSIAYTLGANVENLRLTGTAALSGTGNALNNVLTGNNGNNVLNGAAGADAIAGGLGDDSYIVDNAGDVVTENAVQGFDTIQSSVTFTLAANAEKLLLTGASAINGTGTALADYIVGNTANNVLAGGAGNDLLNGGSGSGADALAGDAGNDVLEGMDGNDVLSDSGGNNVFTGGSGADALTGNSGRELFVGGTGNDTLTTGAAADIIAFNRGDGQDVVNTSTGADNTLSIGGGIRYADMRFTKNANDLVLNLGGSSEKITLGNWYAAPANKSVLNMQVIVEAMADFNAASTDKLVNKKVANFDFLGLATAFDAAGAPVNWALTNALLTKHLSGSDTAALGGDLAYRYGRTGSLANMGFDPVQGILSSGSFGTAAQALQSSAVLDAGSKRLS